MDQIVAQRLNFRIGAVIAAGAGIVSLPADFRASRGLGVVVDQIMAKRLHVCEDQRLGLKALGGKYCRVAGLAVLGAGGLEDDLGADAARLGLLMLAKRAGMGCRAGAAVGFPGVACLAITVADRFSFDAAPGADSGMSLAVVHIVVVMGLAGRELGPAAAAGIDPIHRRHGLRSFLGGVDLHAGDVQSAAVAVVLPVANGLGCLAANVFEIITRTGDDRTAVDGDRAACTADAAADACGASAAGGRDCAAVDGNLAARVIPENGARVVEAAADARAISPAVGCDRTIVDRDYAACAACATANACGVITAGS